MKSVQVADQSLPGRRLSLVPLPWLRTSAPARYIPRYCAVKNAAEARGIGDLEDAFELEQRAADGHVVVQSEAHDLPQAACLIVAPHQIDEDLRPEAAGVIERTRIIDGAEWQNAGRPGAAMSAQLALERRLQGETINIVGREKVPFAAELLDQTWSRSISSRVF